MKREMGIGAFQKSENESVPISRIGQKPMLPGQMQLHLEDTPLGSRQMGLRPAMGLVGVRKGQHFLVFSQHYLGLVGVFLPAFQCNDEYVEEW